MARPRAKADAIFTAIETFATNDAHGNPILIHEGTRLAEKDLVGPSLYWTADGGEAAAAAARLRLRAETARQHQARADAHAEAAKPKVRAIQSFDDFPNLPVTAGEIFDADSEVVQRVPEAFVPA
jgi:hypothetical protein